MVGIDWKSDVAEIKRRKDDAQVGENEKVKKKE